MRFSESDNAFCFIIDSVTIGVSKPRARPVQSFVVLNNFPRKQFSPELNRSLLSYVDVAVRRRVPARSDFTGDELRYAPVEAVSYDSTAQLPNFRNIPSAVLFGQEYRFHCLSDIVSRKQIKPVSIDQPVKSIRSAFFLEGLFT